MIFLNNYFTPRILRNNFEETYRPKGAESKDGDQVFLCQRCFPKIERSNLPIEEQT